jgi:hypothetical protein
LSALRTIAAVAGFAMALLGCAPAGERAWRTAEQLWQRRDPAAFAAWQKLDPATPNGARAHERLNRADQEYRRGIALFSDGDPRARELLETAAGRAPLDPALYLPLARACHRRGLDERAAAMYARFLAQAPAGADAEAARRELGALGDDISTSFEPPRSSPSSWLRAWLLVPMGAIWVAGVWLRAHAAATHVAGDAGRRAS